MAMAPTSCAGCGEPATVYSPDRARCSACLSQFLLATFKKALGRNSAGGDRHLAVALSGGESSAALALLLQSYQKSRNRRPTAARNRTLLLHVVDDASQQTGATPPAVLAVRDAVAASADLVVLRLPRAQVDLLAQVRDANDAHELRCALRMRLLCDAAAASGCEAVLLASSATRIASDTLHATTTKRGASVHFLAATAVASPHHAKLQVIRPLNSTPLRLLVRFARLRMPNVTFVANRAPPLLTLVERFVCEAAQDNASTVHNVGNTARKILASRGHRCVLCDAPVVIDADVGIDGSDRHVGGMEEPSCGSLCDDANGCCDAAAMPAVRDSGTSAGCADKSAGIGLPVTWCGNGTDCGNASSDSPQDLCEPLADMDPRTHATSNDSSNHLPVTLIEDDPRTTDKSLSPTSTAMTVAAPICIACEDARLRADRPQDEHNPIADLFDLAADDTHASFTPLSREQMRAQIADLLLSSDDKS